MAYLSLRRLMTFGAALALSGGRREARALRLGVAHAATPLALMRGFRMAIIGLALLALGAAWMWGILWLAVLAVLIGLGETVESSLMIFGLTRGAKLRLRP